MILTKSMSYQDVFCIQYVVLLAFHCIITRGFLFPDETTLTVLNDDVSKSTNSILVSNQYDVYEWHGVTIVQKFMLKYSQLFVINSQLKRIDLTVINNGILAEFYSTKIKKWYSGPQSNVLYEYIHPLSINVSLKLYWGIKTTRLWCCRRSTLHRSLYCTSFRASEFSACVRVLCSRSGMNLQLSIVERLRYRSIVLNCNAWSNDLISVSIHNGFIAQSVRAAV